MSVRPPVLVRGAGAIVALQGAAGLVIAVILLIRGLAGADQRVANGFGTAAVFALIGAAVLAAGWSLWTGHRWGRGLAVFVQLLLLPVAWYLAVGSHQPAYGIPVGVIALGTLALLFSPPALRWAAAARPATPVTGQAGYDRASSESADPDTR